MSLRDWIRYVAAGLLQLAALLFLIQAGLGVWHQYELSRETYRQYQQRAGADQDKAADEIAEACSVITLVNPALRDCLREQIKSHQKTDATNKDLQAQQDMAYWAFWTVVVGFGGLIVSGVALVFLYRSLRQTRQAISNDREIGEAQVRAYLSVETDEMPRAVTEGDGERLLLACVITYNDVFRRDRKTRFCAYWAPTGQRLRTGHAAYSWFLTNSHNDAT